MDLCIGTTKLVNDFDPIGDFDRDPNSDPNSDPIGDAGRRQTCLAFLAWLLFVVYGSLVPFRVRDLDLAEGIEVFSAITFLDLGIVSRADWIANILLYIPLGFLACACALGLRGGRPIVRPVLAVLFAACVAVAVGVEFLQVFFAPRTVSLNDLTAETIGSGLGILLFALGRRSFARLLTAFRQGGRPSVLAAFAAYGLVYLGLSLFPFDFVLSADELTWKLVRGNQGWLIAGDCADPIRCWARLAGDVLAIAPLGLLMALAFPRVGLRRVLLLGVLIGLGLEAVQLLLVSGISQGLSVILRGAGLAAGWGIGRLLYLGGVLPVARMVRQATPYLVLPYALVLASFSGWFSAPWLSFEAALARLGDVRLLPFYYHYFSTEAAAMASLLSIAGLYGPIGLAVWAHACVARNEDRPGRVRVPDRGHWVAAAMAALVALPIEIGNLLVPPRHPDLTDLLIAAAAAALVYGAATWIARVLAGAVAQGSSGADWRPIPPSSQPVRVPSPPASPFDWPAPRPWGFVLALPPLVLTLWGLVGYPAGSVLLATGLFAYGVALWRWPLIWCFAVPFALPVLNLGPLTGRPLLDELDLLVLVTLAVGAVRYSGSRPRPWRQPLFPVAVSLLWVSFAVASLRGLWPLLPTLGEGLPAASHSPLAAWMVGKGMLWALLLLPLLRRLPRGAGGVAYGYLDGGLIAALLVVTLSVLWQRHIFVGLFDFDNDFRVTGTFSSMHTGGAYIEAFIAFAFPLLIARLVGGRRANPIAPVRPPSIGNRDLGAAVPESFDRTAFAPLFRRCRNLGASVLGALAAGLCVYAMMVTFSRGGYAALVSGLALLALGLARARRDGGPPAIRAPAGAHRRRWLTLATVVGVTAAVALPILSGGFARQRLAATFEDLGVRQAHWEGALSLMDDDWSAVVAGMGLGTYPSRYLLLAEIEKPPGSYRVVEGENPFLRLGAGETVFLDQRVAVSPGTRYRLSVRVRQESGQGRLAVPLCEKALLYSFACQWNTLDVLGPRGDWKRMRIRIHTGSLGRGGNWPHPPVTLSLHNPGPEVIDIDDVSLKTLTGQELVANGDFSRGTARWLFVTDQDLAWHIHQQWLEVYFAQGLIGIAALVLLLLGAASLLLPALWRGNLAAATRAAALTAFLTVGLAGSTLDTARIAMLFYLYALGTGIPTSKTRSEPRDFWSAAPGH